MKALLSKLLFGSKVEEVPEIVHAESPTLQGADIAVAYFSSRAGGDFNDFLRASPTRFLFGLLDVAGKREANTGVLAAAKACFRSSAEQLFGAATNWSPESDPFGDRLVFESPIEIVLKVFARLSPVLCDESGWRIGRFLFRSGALFRQGK